MGNSEAKAKIALDSAAFEKGAKAVINAANAMSAAVTAAFAAAGIAILAAFGANTISSVISSAKSVLDLGESMANAGKRAGLAAGQFYLFNAAVEKGLSMKTVAGLIGENAEVLNRSASIFRDVSIKLWAVGEKIRGFWLGLMERVAPVLSRILDGSLGSALVSAGQWFGEKIANAVEVVYQLAKDGKLWDTLSLGLEIAFKYAGERLLWLAKIGYEVLKLMFSEALFDGINGAVKGLYEYLKDFSKSVGSMMATAFIVLFSVVNDLVNGLLNRIDQALNAVGLLSDSEMASKKKTRDADTKSTYKLAGDKYFNDPKAQEQGNALLKIAQIFNEKESQFSVSDDLQKTIDSLQGTIAGALAGYKADEKSNPPVAFENNKRQAAFGADSLSSIGGGGGVYLGLSVLDVNKAQLSELKMISSKLSALGGNNSLTVNNNTTPQEITRMQTSSGVN